VSFFFLISAEQVHDMGEAMRDDGDGRTLELGRYVLVEGEKACTLSPTHATERMRAFKALLPSAFAHILGRSWLQQQKFQPP